LFTTLPPSISVFKKYGFWFRYPILPAAEPLAAAVPVPIPTFLTAEPVAIPTDRAPLPPRETEAIYQIWRQVTREEGRPNLNETQRRIYQNTGGTYHDWAAFAINDALHRRGKARLYTVKEVNA
jgi:hypothetical protein